MLIARRNLMGGKPLPYLRRVAYLQPIGRAFIDTDYFANQDSDVSVIAEYGGSSYDRIFGSYNDVNAAFTIVSNWNIKNLGVRFGNFTEGVEILGEVKRNLRLNKTGFYVDDEVVIPIDYSSTFQSIHPSWLFLTNPSTANSSCKVYECSIYERGDLIKHFIPVLDLSGRPAMYDEVSEQFLYNEGSGDFAWYELETASNAPSQLRGGVNINA